MDPETLKALKASIEKWQRVVDENPGEQGAKDCALCGIYNTGGEYVECLGCPVSEETDAPHCENSPYQEWLYAAAWDGIDKRTWRDDKGKQAAIDMRDFLIDLLPKQDGRV